MNAEHDYAVRVEWQGNLGTGTSGYREYSRQHTVFAAGKHLIAGSADRTFHGDRERWNPEEMLLGAISQCHMLSYLHVAVKRSIIVTAYEDQASGVLVQRGLGGSFREATLRPVVTVAEEWMIGEAIDAHAEAAEHCFIANSVNFPIAHRPLVRVARPRPPIPERGAGEAREPEADLSGS
ncbi:OsmC family protein [Leucobacter sp. M11]|uniref:OsmC family protein n=1 Tax=Leucobacter sp. M11 TaxID=2993565 RepID=UPI002D7EEF52|nr:OsmC family protein [Leucobacter sp. M11]MEB4615654.1 OsmC family protein [Leucobacter sp. M11]